VRWLVERETEVPAKGASLAEVLDRVRRIEIKTRRLVDSLFAGSYRSAFKGRGLEFRDVREYDDADDVRLIDWNVTARTGLAHVRQYEEERELTIMVALDVSASSAFGTVRAFKRELAVEFAGCVGFSAARSNDRFGALLFSDRVEAFVPPRKGRRHVLRILRDALAVQPSGRGTRLAAALEAVSSRLTKRCVVFVVSDFIDGDYAYALRVAALRHEVIAVETLDPREGELPSVGLVELMDPEAGAAVTLDTSRLDVREGYANAVAEARKRRLSLLRSSGVDVISLRTDEDMLAPLMRFFRARQRGGRRR
jgi:uncharacterized protein (DUF58 family)